jgi:dTDP-4-dehydrorhamnose reductase
MNILLTGAAGQLGQALRQQLPAGIELIATSRSGDPAAGLLPLDLADATGPPGCSMAAPTPLLIGPRANRSWPWR